jgi:NAD(P)-dependent dehydrogenase (short-subunit alcohol dehydrogenase family)
MDELRFDGRTAIVTGAGGGLGSAYATLLASRGANVVVNDLGGSLNGVGGDESAAQKVVDAITAAGGVAVPDYNSVATSEGGAAMVQTALDAFGSIDIVVNNAGILRDKTLHNLEEADFDAVIAVHLKGGYNVTRPAYLKMREQGYGRIVMTSSVAGLYGNFGQTNYSAAKMGVIGMAKTISVEGAKYNVKANVISPNALTRMTEGIMGEVGQYMKAEWVAPMVAYLCHESCEAAGQVYAAMGGLVTKVFIAETKGYFSKTLSLEEIAEHIEQIDDRKEFNVYASIAGPSPVMLKHHGIEL